MVKMADVNVINGEDESGLASYLVRSLPLQSSTDKWWDEKEFTRYLSELSSYSLEKLVREPEKLSEEKKELLERTQDLAFHNYKTFIQTAQCSKDIFSDFTNVEEHLNELIEKLPTLRESCSGFIKRSGEIREIRAQNSVALTKHSQLLEVLEMPQLMDTCVRNGYYEEAMELAAHVAKLEVKHKDITIIMDIAEEVKECKRHLITHLIQQFRCAISLAQCLKVIGLLRRMDVFDECELRILFLQARDTWFRSTLKSISTEDAYFHLSKTIDVSRVNLFEVITQYKAIFSDPSLSTVTMETTLLTSWIHYKMTEFVDVFQQDLTRGVSPHLDSIIAQSMFFGLAFSRVGADFRPLISPIIITQVSGEFNKAVQLAVEDFEESLHSFSFSSVESGSEKAKVFARQNSEAGSEVIPYHLIPYTPLAHYTNQVVGGFNQLRLCLPINLVGEVTGVVQESLLHLSRKLAHLYRSEGGGMKGNEVEGMRKMCQALISHLLPYINRCLSIFFPPSQLTQLLSCSPIKLREMRLMGHLDVASIIHELKDLDLYVDAHLMDTNVASSVIVEGVDDGDSRVDDGDSRVDDGDSRVDDGDSRVDDGDSRVDDGDSRVDDGDSRVDDDGGGVVEVQQEKCGDDDEEKLGNGEEIKRGDDEENRGEEDEKGGENAEKERIRFDVG